MSKSIVIVDGNLVDADLIDRSVVIVLGNVGGVRKITKSVILATGSYPCGTTCDNTFLQIRNSQLALNGSDCVLLKTKVFGNNLTNQVLDVDKGPLQLLKYNSRKSEDDE